MFFLLEHGPAFRVRDLRLRCFGLAEAKASGLALVGNSFIVMRRFSYGWSEAFKPYRIGDVGAMLRHIVGSGRNIYSTPNGRR